MQNTSTLLADQLPKSKRWALTCLACTWGIGGAIIALLGALLNLWDVEAVLIFRIVGGFIELSVIILFIMRCFLDETPKFYLS